MHVTPITHDTETVLPGLPWLDLTLRQRMSEIIDHKHVICLVPIMGQLTLTAGGRYSAGSVTSDGIFLSEVHMHCRHLRSQSNGSWMIQVQPL